MLREKDKEIAKIKQEMTMMRRESQEKTKTEQQVSKEAET